MASILSLGGGASEGLDTVLTRMMLQQRQAEVERSNRADEASRGRQLDQQQTGVDALAEDRRAQTAARVKAAADEVQTKAEEDKYLADPAGNPLLKSYIQMRRIVPKGEQVPYQLFTEPNGPPGSVPSAELKPFKITDPALAKATGRKVGDVIDGNYNPKTQKVMYRGQDVTSGVDHYEKPNAPIVVQTVDANGNPISKIVPKTAGAEYAAKPGQTVEGRLSSAQAVSQSGEDMIRQLSDPAFRDIVGPAMGRANTLRDFIGNPPPEFAQLAGEIESYALANMGVHGMRSAQGAEMIKHMLDEKHTPESLVSIIKGLNNFSRHYIENAGRKPATGSVGDTSGAGGGDAYQRYLQRTKK